MLGAPGASPAKKRPPPGTIWAVLRFVAVSPFSSESAAQKIVFFVFCGARKKKVEIVVISAEKEHCMTICVEKKIDFLANAY